MAGRTGQVNIWAALQTYFGWKTGRDTSNVVRRIFPNVSLQWGLTSADTSDVDAIKVDTNSLTQLDNPYGTQALAFSTLQLSTPSAPTLTLVGSTGSTTYTYKLVATDGTGVTAGTSPASSATSVTNGPSSLSASNYINIQVADTLATATIGIGNITYNVYRTAGGGSTGKIGTITIVQNGGLITGNSLLDTGLSGDSTTAPTTNTTGVAVFNGPVYGAGSGGQLVYGVAGTATLAQINAGTTLVTGVAGRVITPMNYWLQMNGTFTTSTDIRLSDTTPTADICIIPIASAVTGANFGPASPGFVNNATTAHASTTSAGFGAALGTGLGIQIRQTGSTAAGGTSIYYAIQYLLT